MKLIFNLIILSFFLASCEKVANMEELNDNDGVHFKKNSKVPFSGKIEGLAFGVYTKGQMKNGKPEGEWFFYHNNGNLDRVGKFYKGKQDGKWYFYDKDAKHLKTEVFENGILIETSKN